MEKRYVTFIILSLILVIGHQLFMATFFPAPPKPPAEAEAEQDPAEAAPDENNAEQADDEGPAVADANGEQPAAADGDNTPNNEEASASPKQIPLQWSVLGSYRDGKHVVYLNNDGAAVRRVELVERRANGKLKYRDLANKSGYLGYLALQPMAGGCRVQVVAPGTPAAEAGLQPGDVIVSAGEKDITDPYLLTEALKAAKPGDEFALTVRRDGQTRSLTATLDQRPLALVHNEIDLLGERLGHPDSFLMSLESIRGEGQPNVRVKLGQNEIANLRSMRTHRWEVNESEGQVQFKWNYSTEDLKKVGVTGALEITKTFKLIPDPGANDYHLDFDVRLRNTGQSPLQVAYRLDGPNGLPTEGWWYLYKVHPSWGTGGARDVAWESAARGYELRSASQIWKRAKNNPKAPREPGFVDTEDTRTRTVQFAGVDTQYFHVALLPTDENGELTAREFAELTPFLYNPPTSLDKNHVRLANVSFYLISETQLIEPSQTVEDRFAIFLGPKRSDVLSLYGLDETIVWGWFWWVAWPLSSLLHFFYMVVRNYGLAILMLTIMVRACVHPISRKAHQNAQMMQALAPETKKITERYKDEPQKRMEAQQELYKKYNFNPLSGCLLAFAQFPIFIGLYRCLSVDIELRDAPLIPGVGWATNLAGPDMLYEWGPNAWPWLTDYTGWLGPYFNVLPLFSVVLFLVQQQMFTPPPTDEQQAMSQKMMKGMTFVIGILFYKVAAGLCLYIIISSLWGVLERQLMPKKDLETLRKQKEEAAQAKLSSQNEARPKRSSQDVKKAENAVRKNKRKGKGR